MVKPYPLTYFLQDSPDASPPRAGLIRYYPLFFGSTTITVASTFVFPALGTFGQVDEFSIYNNGANPMWVTYDTADVPIVSAAVGQGILLNPGDLLVEDMWWDPRGTTAIAVGGSTSAVWQVVE